MDSEEQSVAKSQSAQIIQNSALSKPLSKNMSEAEIQNDSKLSQNQDKFKKQGSAASLKSIKSMLSNKVGSKLMELGKNETNDSFIVEENPGQASGDDGRGPLTEDVFALENLM